LRPRRPSSPRWRTFLREHAKEIWACDFLQLYDAWFRPIFAFFLVEHASRRVIQVSVTAQRHPEWRGPTLPRARSRYQVRRSSIRTPVRAPRANAVCERFLGSVRRECLDHLLILGERHLERVLAEYARYFNVERPHQGLAQQIPTGAATPANIDRRVIETPVLGGLHHAYRRAA
jgi:putative transposase